MKTEQFIEQASQETSDLCKEIDKLVDSYLAKSRMPKDQKIVNVGRALNAYHVQWIANLSASLEQRHELMKRGPRDPSGMASPKKALDL
jgi:hypothetical protein